MLGKFSFEIASTLGEKPCVEPKIKLSLCGAEKKIVRSTIKEKSIMDIISKDIALGNAVLMASVEDSNPIVNEASFISDPNVDISSLKLNATTINPSKDVFLDAPLPVTNDLKSTFQINYDQPTMNSIFVNTIVERNDVNLNILPGNEVIQLTHKFNSNDKKISLSKKKLCPSVYSMQKLPPVYSFNKNPHHLRQLITHSRDSRSVVSAKSELNDDFSSSAGDILASYHSIVDLHAPSSTVHTIIEEPISPVGETVPDVAELLREIQDQVNNFAEAPTYSSQDLMRCSSEELIRRFGIDMNKKVDENVPAASVPVSWITLSKIMQDPTLLNRNKFSNADLMKIKSMIMELSTISSSSNILGVESVQRPFSSSSKQGEDLGPRSRSGTGSRGSKFRQGKVVDFESMYHIKNNPLSRPKSGSPKIVFPENLQQSVGRSKSLKTLFTNTEQVKRGIPLAYDKDCVARYQVPSEAKAIAGVNHILAKAKTKFHFKKRKPAKSFIETVPTLTPLNQLPRVPPLLLPQKNDPSFCLSL